MKILVGLLAFLLGAATTFGGTPEAGDPPVSPCTPPLSCEGCVPCEGAITAMTLVHRGPTDALVTVYQGDVAVFCDVVPPCEPFAIYEGHWPGPLGADLILHINDQYATTIPMTCDPDLYVGAEFGPFVVFAATSEAGPLCPKDCLPPPPPPPGPCDECDGKVTTLTLAYEGTSEATIRVEQKKGLVIFEAPVSPGGAFTIFGHDKQNTLGTEITLLVDGRENAKIHTSCSQPIGPGLVAGSFRILAGESRNGGPLCPLDTPPGTPPSSGCGCEGKVTSLVLRWNGEASAFVEVQQKDGQIAFAGNVAPGDTMSLLGSDKHGTLGTEVRFFVEGIPDVAIHTSCSQPIGPGLVVGRFEVVYGESLKGGELCAVAPDAQGSGGSPKAPKSKRHKKPKD